MLGIILYVYTLTWARILFISKMSSVDNHWCDYPMKSYCVCGCMCGREHSVACCVWLFAILWIVARQAPLSMGFSRHEYGSGLPCSPPRGSSQTRDWPWVSCISGSFFTTEPPGKPHEVLLLSPILQMRKPRHRAIQESAQVHTRKWGTELRSEPKLQNPCSSKY